MRDPAMICEALGELGELRLYRRAGPPAHLAVEVLREADGRAWTLRVPWAQRSMLRQVLSDSLWRLSSASPPVVEAEDHTMLARGQIAAGDELTAIVLSEGERRAFALWRRELSGRGEWDWTLDLVLVPEALAAPLCRQIQAGLDRLEPAQSSAAQSGQT